MILVSVLMPAYNVSAYIIKAIESILQQSYPHFELIISDDASKDDTIEKILSFNDPRITLIRNKSNLGYTANMNLLLKSARGEMMMIQDGDDYAHPRRIEILLGAFKSQPEVAMIGSALIRFDDTGKEDVLDYPTDQLEIQRKFDGMDPDSPVVCGTTMFKREIIDSGILFRGMKYINRGQDNDFLFRISENYKIGNVADRLYYYRYNPTSMTLNIKKQSIYDFFAWDYIYFLKNQRKELNGKDSLALQQWDIIEKFYKNTLRAHALKVNDKAWYEMHLSYHAFQAGEKKFGIRLLVKAFFKKPSIGLLKRIIYLSIN